jgi:hypothetical protein
LTRRKRCRGAAFGAPLLSGTNLESDFIVEIYAKLGHSSAAPLLSGTNLESDFIVEICAEMGRSSAVQCHDMIYTGCQDILYTWTFRSVFDGAFAESAEGARRATGADFANAARGATSACVFSPIGSISRMYMSR